MRVVLQRVRSARVTIDTRVTGEIGIGFCLFVGFTHDDGPAQVDWMAGKISGLRLFPDHDGKMNHCLTDVAGEVLVVSQFTLYGDTARGRRPSFIAAAPPEIANPLYEQFLAALRAHSLPVATGEFGAMMDVALVNDGPVTLLLERE